MNDYKELMDTMAKLNAKVQTLEDTYMENGGEVTEETEAAESEILNLRDFLGTDGVDVLGRWLKAKEDEKKAIKAEKDFLSRKVQSIDNTIDFIKGRLTAVMDAAGIEKAKGTHGYSFTRTTSRTTTLDKDFLNERYEGLLHQIRIAYAIPNYITLTLGASSSVAKVEGLQPEDKGLFVINEKDTITFRKPKADKED